MEKNTHIQHVVYQNALQVAKKTCAFSVTGRNKISFYFTFTDIFWSRSIYHPLQFDNFNVTNQKIHLHLCMINFISNLYTTTWQVRFRIPANWEWSELRWASSRSCWRTPRGSAPVDLCQPGHVCACVYVCACFSSSSFWLCVL